MLSPLSSQACTRVKFGNRPTAEPVRPHAVFLDSYSKKELDIDGDGVPDVSHGTLMERIALSQCPSLEVSSFDVMSQGSDYLHLNLGAALNSLRQFVREGVNVDGVNISLASEASLPKPDEGNLLKNRNQFFNGFITHNPDLLPVLTGIRELINRSIPVYVAAGNSGQQPRLYNVFNLVEGSTNVAATDAKGKMAPYSTNNSLTNCYEQGSMAVIKVKGGYDITGDGKADIRDDEVSGGEPFAARFIGKPGRQVIATAKDLGKLGEALAQNHFSLSFEPLKKLAGISILTEKLFKVEDLHQLGVLSASQYEYYRGMGDYLAMQPRHYMQKGQWEPFRLDSRNRVVYDPDGSGKKGAVNCIHGTSGANARALGRAMQQKLEQTADHRGRRAANG